MSCESPNKNGLNGWVRADPRQILHGLRAVQDDGVKRWELGRRTSPTDRP